MKTSSPNIPKPGSETKSRLMALLVAGLICFISAVSLGYGAHKLFGTQREAAARPTEITTSEQKPETSTVVTEQPSPTPTPALSVPVVLAPAGELAVEAATVEFGGGDTNLPARREYVAAFAVGETEVTNAHYQKFIEATQHPAPKTWKNNQYPDGADDLPVTNINWKDAVAYCEWLSKEIGATVRLPTEAEWTLAARGAEGRLYPWGNEWRDGAALSIEDKGEIKPVKSFPDGRSPVGAYEMAGNVWEWTSDLARDEQGKERVSEGIRQRIVKGGSVGEKRVNLTAIARAAIKETSAFPQIGFRYVVIRAGAPSNADNRPNEPVPSPSATP